MADAKAQRRLTVILAADVVGYSRLMQQDEDGTLAVLKARRKGVLEPLVAKHQGRVFKVVGDGVLVEFASAVSAVQCAIDIQEGMAAANMHEPEDRQIVLRTGVNLGDVIVEGGDLYGDAVNVAARLQALAAPGEILIGGTAFDQVKNKIGANPQDIGVQNLKNIAEPVRAYRISGPTTLAAAVSRTGDARPSIAVLPFVNMSGDREQEYFSDGITEDIITELSRFRNLFVVARNSSFAFKDKAIDVRRVAQELGVQYVVEGSVRKGGDRVRVTAQLIDAPSGSHIWSERYDREMRDIFALQDDLANAVAANVGGRIDAAGRERTARLSPAGLRAYDLVLRGRAAWFRLSRHSNAEARSLLSKAIELDPNSAQAYANYAQTLFLDYMADWVADGSDSLNKGFDAAKQAVTLDPTDTAARWVLGQMYLYRREYAEARIHLDKAMELNPNDADVIALYGLLLASIGQAGEAIEQFEIAKRRNQLGHVSWPWLLGIACYTARRYDDAIAALSQIHEPVNEVRMWLAASYAQTGKLAEAQVKLREFLNVAKDDMMHFPGSRAEEWKQYLHRAIEYRDESDFLHLQDGLRKAGLPI